MPSRTITTSATENDEQAVFEAQIARLRQCTTMTELLYLMGMFGICTDKETENMTPEEKAEEKAALDAIIAQDRVRHPEAYVVDQRHACDF